MKIFRYTRLWHEVLISSFRKVSFLVWFGWVRRDGGKKVFLSFGRGGVEFMRLGGMTSGLDALERVESGGRDE